MTPSHQGRMCSSMVSTYASAPVAQIQLPFCTAPSPTQNWTLYNRAQCEEKSRFIEFLGNLCQTIPQPEYTFGRPRLPLADMIFACTYKVYSGFSSRRFTSDLRDAHTKGLVSSTPYFTSVARYLSDPELTPLLTNLVTASSLPLKSIETNFAIDSSGFSTSRFVRWFNKKCGRETDNREWVKCHLFTGTKTNIVTSVDISGWTAHDTNYFEPLLERTARYFNIDEVSADKAYLSHKNLEIAALAGAMPFIPFKSNTVPVQIDNSMMSSRIATISGAVCTLIGSRTYTNHSKYLLISPHC